MKTSYDEINESSEEFLPEAQKMVEVTIEAINNIKVKIKSDADQVILGALYMREMMLSILYSLRNCVPANFDYHNLVDNISTVVKDTITLHSESK